MRLIGLLSMLGLLITLTGCEDAVVGSSDSRPYCDECRSELNIALRWMPNTDDVSGYKVYYSAEPYISETEISDVTVDSEGFDMLTPTASYKAWDDLALRKGDRVCFRVRAYVDDALSDFSPQQCGLL